MLPGNYTQILTEYETFHGMIVQYNHENEEGEVYIFDKNKTFFFRETIWSASRYKPKLFDLVGVQFIKGSREIRPILVTLRFRIEETK
jgi:hypothetical protein